MADTSFTLDIWYFAGLSSDLKTGQMRRIVIAGLPINLGRDESGTLFAMYDICPHRAAPLSKGCLKDGTVQCPYHGWRFAIDCAKTASLCGYILALTPRTSARQTSARRISRSRRASPPCKTG